MSDNKSGAKLFKVLNTKRLLTSQDIGKVGEIIDTFY